MSTTLSTRESTSEPTSGAFRLRPLLLALGAFLIYCLHSALFGSWIVDDAGISFVYARNWAAGHGLVSQPGLAPVEGYSNFLWVAILAVLFKSGIFDPLWTPKILSLALVAASFLLLTTATNLDKHQTRFWPWPEFIAMLLLALNTPFVVWTSSGLENALFVFLLTCLFLISLRAATPLNATPLNGNPINGKRAAVAAAVVALLVALTRPDGLLYAAAFPLSLWAARLFAPPETQRIQTHSATPIPLYGILFLVGYGLFIGFRFVYFGELVPNTFYAKSGSSKQILLDLLTLQPTMRSHLAGLLSGVGGRAGVVFLILLYSAHLILAWKRKLPPAAAISLMFLGFATLSFVLLPADWMEELRFATPFTLFFYLWAATLWAAAQKARPFASGASSRPFFWSPIVSALVALVVVAVHLIEFAPRSLAFSRSPTVPFAWVAREFGEKFNRYSEVLDVPNPSLLNPDLGGTLYYSKLRIYDLAGLTDKTIARSRFQNPHPSRIFYDYVFEEARPTFIHVHSWWSLAARFDNDPRFRRDYVPIAEEVDATILRSKGETIYAGDYVRKSACSAQKLGMLRRMAAVK